jgi:hypothetical protein
MPKFNHPSKWFGQPRRPGNGGLFAPQTWEGEVVLIGSILALILANLL